MRNRPQTTTVLKPLQPVHGTAQWLHEPIWPCEMIPAGLPGMLLIHAHGLDTVYLVTAVLTDGLVTAYRLTKSNGEKRHVAAGSWQCDCADSAYRPNRPDGCKHARALKAALRRLGATVLEVAPAPVDVAAAVRLAADTGFLPRGHFDPDTEAAIAGKLPALAEEPAGHWYSRHFSGD